MTDDSDLPEYLHASRAFALRLTGGKIVQSNGDSDGNAFGKFSLGRYKDSIFVACFSITDSGMLAFFYDAFFLLHRTGVGFICPMY